MRFERIEGGSRTIVLTISSLTLLKMKGLSWPSEETGLAHDNHEIMLSTKLVKVFLSGCSGVVKASSALSLQMFEENVISTFCMTRAHEKSAAISCASGG